MKFLVLFPAFIHVYIFVLESFLWGRPRTNQTFGLRPADVEATRALAFNQGVYNLLFAIMAVAGLALWAGVPAVEKGPFAGRVLLMASLGAMIVAGLTLMASSPSRWRAAVVQWVPAALGLIVVFAVE